MLCPQELARPWQLYCQCPVIKTQLFSFLFQAIDEPPYLTVGTDVSAKYRGAFCEAKIKTAKRLVKVKVCGFPANAFLGEKNPIIEVQNSTMWNFFIASRHLRGCPFLGGWQCSLWNNSKLIFAGRGGVPATPTQLNTFHFFHCFVICLHPVFVAFNAIGWP